MKAYILYYTTNGQFELLEELPDDVVGYIAYAAEIEISRELFDKLNKHIRDAEGARNQLMTLWKAAVTSKLDDN